MKKQVQLQPYRLVVPADLPDLATATLLAQYVIETGHFDGVTLDVDLAAGEPEEGEPEPPTPGFKLDVLFLDRSTGKLIEDKSQAISVNGAGAQTFQVETGGRPVYIRVSQLSGFAPVLTIRQGAYAASKV